MSEPRPRVLRPLGDFTYDRYSTLLDAAIAGRYTFLTVREYLRRETPPDRFVVMRHDVDRKPENALDLARIEADRDFSSSYYFRTVDATFKPRIIEAVEALGHEVGYHYEDVDRADGDLERATERFTSDLARFREHVDVDTVSMHGNPLTPYDNRDLWEATSFEEHRLEGEVYLSIDFTEVVYFSDTNRTWYDEKTIVNDWPVGASEKPVQITATDDLIGILEGGRLDRLYLLVHPDRWVGSYPELVNQRLRDAAINGGKWLLWNVRRFRRDGHQPRDDGEVSGDV